MALRIPALTDVAYFSMEVMLETDIPTYSGGLGMLAGDILRSCADLNINAVGVSLVYSGEVFRQHIQADGSQTFIEVEWKKMDHLTKLTDKITLNIHNEEVQIGVWRYDIVGLEGHVVPVFLLDAHFPQNSQWSRQITRNLYADRGDLRIAQEIVLGIGGVKMLRKLGYSTIRTFHLNEGHCAFVPLALLEENEYKDEPVRKLCTFTTHTPIPEGHDTFDYDFAYRYAEKYLPWHIREIASPERLHMTRLAANMSKYTCGVSEKHQKVSQHIFPDLKIHHITNGVHHRTWTSPILQDLYEAHIPGFLQDPGKLKTGINNIPDTELWDAHYLNKRRLIEYVNKHQTAISDSPSESPALHEEDLFHEDTFTIAMARRPVAYKRPLLLYKNLERLLEVGEGRLQIIQCGKSHPHDEMSQGIVKEIVRISRELRGKIRVVYLEDYSPRIARLLVSGSDIWLNTPMQPLEASGTSGMKAALNGVLNFSVPDGWWLEGYRMNPDAGWLIGTEIDGLEASFDDEADANSIYDQLESTILPTYYNDRPQWIRRMKQAITLGAYFNTHRCVREYKKLAWDA
jgi:glycogen phosphorylase